MQIPKQSSPHLQQLTQSEVIRSMVYIAQGKAIAPDGMCESIFKVNLDSKSHQIDNENLERAKLFQNPWSVDSFKEPAFRNSLNIRLIPINIVHP